MPALVWTFRNSQRGWTRIVSSFVTLSGSRALTGAFFSCPAATAAKPAAAAAAAPAAITSRRFMAVLPPKKTTRRHPTQASGEDEADSPGITGGLSSESNPRSPPGEHRPDDVQGDIGEKVGRHGGEEAASPVEPAEGHAAQAVGHEN